MSDKEYKLQIDPAILKLLGPSLYTNIYYVLAELIANAWDADAKNVYIIDKGNEIIVEDDGIGMSYSKGDVNKYLNVAEETRVDKEDSKTSNNRLKMGRKGIGKLSALAVSPNVSVMTISSGEKSGFILSREVPKNGLLEPIREDDVTFEKIDLNGTSIRMPNPEYKLNKGLEVIKKNLIKMFPVVSSDFRIHIIRGDKSTIIDSFDTNIIKELASIITIGDEYKPLTRYFNPEVKEKILELKDERDEFKETVELLTKEGELEKFELIIKGWIGAYRSTRGRKVELLEFQDNFLSLYSNGKMGEFNILPRIGQNKLPEVFVVGQLHIDLFEETSLPDMALSNRQGYKDDDKRYEIVSIYAQKLLAEIINMRIKWTSIKKKEGREQEFQQHKSREVAFKENILAYESNVTYDVASLINTHSTEELSNPEVVETIVREALEKHKSLLGLKPLVDRDKKKILISQTRHDKDLADTIYEMLLFNGIPKKDIIFSNADDEISRIPEGHSIYDYLRSFFVDSISDEKMYVIYVTSTRMGQSWGAIVEVGANWITQMNHKIFNVEGFRPEHPLDDNLQWHQSRRVENKLCMDSLSIDIFCQKIEAVCDDLGYTKKSRDENKTKLKTLVLEQ
ncbi:MAG: ATP-binding protein [Candidatus Izemoplasmatales bacterium]|nr:ATP-binding protein [Candidatus Izemoplasmatales bacterium]